MTTHTRLPRTPATLVPADSGDWRREATCQYVDDPEVFFPIGQSPQALAQEMEAKGICSRCPVVKRCLEWALETCQDSGVWGGLTETERLKLRRAKATIRVVTPPKPRTDKQHSHRYPGYASAVDGIIGTRLDEMQKLIEERASVYEMADALGTHVPTVRKVLERLGQSDWEETPKVDPAAVDRFLKGFASEVRDADFLAAVQVCVERGMTLPDIDRLQVWEPKTTEHRVNRLRKQYRRAGWEFPALKRPSVREFTDQEVLEIREKSHAGATDLELAMSYDTKRETIRSICRGLSHRNVGGPIRPARRKVPKASREFMCGHGENSLAAKPKGWKDPVLTVSQRAVVRERVEAGEATKALAAEYGVSARTIRRYAA